MTEYSLAKTAEYLRKFPIFKTVRVAKKRFEGSVAPKYAKIFVLGHFLFPRAHSEVRFSKKKTSVDKYPSIFSRQMEAIII